MGEPISTAGKIPTTLPGNPPLDVPLTVDGRTLQVTCVSMGNPHCVTFVDEPPTSCVLGLGPKVEQHPLFPRRVNVEFVEVMSPTRSRHADLGARQRRNAGLRHRRRAVCVAGVLTGRTERRIITHLPGGDLELEWRESRQRVYMTGPATKCSRGEWPDSSCFSP